MTVFHWCRTVFFLIPAISSYTIVLGLVSLTSMLVDRRGNVAHQCARAWAWLILATTGVEVRRSEIARLDRRRAYLFASNHQSIYDIPIVFASLPFQLRILAKKSLGSFPFLGWHLRHTGHVLVDRTKPGTMLFRRVAELIRGGESLIVFPEGTRSIDGRVAPFRGGVFYLAIEAGLPVVPVSIQGSRHVMRKGRLATRPGAVRLTVHPAIETRGLAEGDAKHLAERVRSIVETDLMQAAQLPATSPRPAEPAVAS